VTRSAPAAASASASTGLELQRRRGWKRWLPSRRLLSRNRFRNSVPDPAQALALRRHAQVLQRALREPLRAGNRVELLVDGPATYAAMFAAIDGARDHINLESYIVEAAGPGAELARRLIAKSREGVRVNLLYDGFGSLLTDGRYFAALREAGVAVCEYNPLRAWRKLFSRSAHWRDHRKLLVVDGRIAFVGGVNISGVYAAGSAHRVQSEVARGETRWRDTHVQVEGPLVSDLQRLFLQHWGQHAGQPLMPADYLPPPVAAGVQQAASASGDAGRRSNPFYRALVAAIDAARQSVFVTAAYFVPTRRLLRALANAARRGVDVKLVLPSLSDAWAPLHAGRSHYGHLLQAGVRIFERQGALLHAKTTVIDGVWATVGSSNLDWRSVIHNAEANVIVLDSAFGAAMEALFVDDLAASRETSLQQWHGRGLLQRLREALARRFEFLL
jgi:cardiolipin synthase